MTVESQPSRHWKSGNYIQEKKKLQKNNEENNLIGFCPDRAREVYAPESGEFSCVGAGFRAATMGQPCNHVPRRVEDFKK